MGKYIYPKFPALYTTPFFRIAGNGLANCLFVYAKAIVLAHRYNAKIIAPTWFNLTIGPYIRKQKDKRHYLGLFNHKQESSWLNLVFNKTTRDEAEFCTNGGVLIVEGIYDFFKPLLGYGGIVNEYILNHISDRLLDSVYNHDFSNSVAVHIRLGDFPESRRVPMSWYVEKIKEYGKNRNILIFSDGTDKELEQILSLENTRRVYFGGAIQDIIAISRCQYVIGSDSSFSAWGAYLGQVPCCFYRLQFGQILEDCNNQIIENK